MEANGMCDMYYGSTELVPLFDLFETIFNPPSLCLSLYYVPTPYRCTDSAISDML